MRAIVATTSTASWPIAVSPESITASVPSNTALATSLTSARVGAGAAIIDSSICVAVMTGVPTLTQWRMMCFCRCGTSSSGQSMPRSPRATITASAASVIAASSPSADAVSILATMPARSADDLAQRQRRRRPGARTTARRTRRRPPRRPRPARGPARSGRTSAAARTTGARRGGPACARRSRPRHSTRPSSIARTRIVMPPSPMTMRSPGSRSVEQRRVVDGRRASAVLGPAPGTRRTGSPASRSTPPSGNYPARIFGPGRSASTPTGRPTVGGHVADQSPAARGGRRAARG